MNQSRSRRRRSEAIDWAETSKYAYLWLSLQVWFPGRTKGGMGKQKIKY